LSYFDVLLRPHRKKKGNGRHLWFRRAVINSEENKCPAPGLRSSYLLRHRRVRGFLSRDSLRFCILADSASCKTSFCSLSCCSGGFGGCDLDPWGDDAPKLGTARAVSVYGLSLGCTLQADARAWRLCVSIPNLFFLAPTLIPSVKGRVDVNLLPCRRRTEVTLSRAPVRPKHVKRDESELIPRS